MFYSVMYPVYLDRKGLDNHYHICIYIYIYLLLVPTPYLCGLEEGTHAREGLDLFTGLTVIPPPPYAGGDGKYWPLDDRGVSF